MTKKIALAIEHFSRHRGGAEAYAVNLAERLIDAGWEVHFYGLSWDGRPPAARFHPIHIPSWLPTSAKLLAFALIHRRMVRARSYDVILGFGNTIHMNVYQTHGGVHRVSTAKKLYATSAGLPRTIKRLAAILSVKYWVREWIESAAFRLQPRPRIVAISDMIKDDMIKTYEVRPEEIQIVYNGIDPIRFSPERLADLKGIVRKRFNLKEDEVIFLFISHDLRKKGMDVLIEAAGLLKRQGTIGFKVLAVGGRPGRSTARLIDRLGLEGIVIFTGPSQRPEEFYADGQVLVLPTYYDACSLVVIEALAAGLPAITTAANGAAGLLRDGRTGYVIGHPPQPVELAEKMALLLDPRKHGVMSLEAAATGRNFSMDNALKELIGIFEVESGLT